MDPKFRKAQERSLIQERKRIEKELARHAAKRGRRYLAKFEEYGSKDDDAVLEVAVYQEHLSLERNLQRVLKDIDQALGKIGKGTYGLCERGRDHEIEPERLKAAPQARFCLKHSRP